MPVFPYSERETTHLKARDKKLGAVIEKIGPIERGVEPDIIAALIRSIVSQQISTKAAATVCGRLRALTGLNPGRIAIFTVEDIRNCGMSLRKAGYIKGVAEAALSGALDVRTFAEQSDEEIVAALSSLRGVGVWTAEMLLIFSLCRPNVLSWGDLAIRRGIMKLCGLQTLAKKDFERLRARWSPYASVASLYLWAYSALPEEARAENAPARKAGVTAGPETNPGSRAKTGQDTSPETAAASFVPARRAEERDSRKARRRGQVAVSSRRPTAMPIRRATPLSRLSPPCKEAVRRRAF